MRFTASGVLIAVCFTFLCMACHVSRNSTNSGAVSPQNISEKMALTTPDTARKLTPAELRMQRYRAMQQNPQFVPAENTVFKKKEVIMDSIP